LTCPLDVSSSLDMSSSTSRPSPSPPILLSRRSLISCCRRFLARLQLHPWLLHPRMSSNRDLHPLFCRSFSRMIPPLLCVAMSFAWRLRSRRLSPGGSGLGSDVAVSSLQLPLTRPDGFVPEDGPPTSSSCGRVGGAVAAFSPRLSPRLRSSSCACSATTTGLSYGACSAIARAYTGALTDSCPDAVPSTSACSSAGALSSRYSHRSRCHTEGVVPEPQHHYIFPDTVADSDELPQRLGRS
jgi:hypothetical protein